ncbi:glycerate kinase [Ruania alba]|uniref:Glycerate kinase n=1 Tax=Ruania alba TaxID=648782 RepID=A0A1H5NHH0_9MICO|nr:glycerate kinase [Ruania alba]SEF01053.1 glycerate kinase [Ruania alba]
MKIVLAPDSFKGSLTAAEVAEHLARGARRAVAGADTVEVPIADGGEGTVAAAVAAGYTPVQVHVTGALGARVTATYARHAGHAVIEMAAAAGLDQVGPDAHSARTSGTEGVGELIRHALDAGATEVLLGLGGSATSDGGAGLARALGVGLRDADGRPLEAGGAALTHLAEVDLAGLDPRLAGLVGGVSVANGRSHDANAPHIVLAADVTSPLLGADGAAAVFGPQKGATPEVVAELETGLARWVAALAEAGVPRARELAESPGAGAAGGLGYGAMVLLAASRRSGIEEVLRMVGFADQVQGADLVITGEGSMDAQSLAGKAPVGVAEMARAAGVPVLAVVGRRAVDQETAQAHGISAVHALLDLEPDVDRCLANAGELAEQVAENAVRTWTTRT